MASSTISSVKTDDIFTNLLIQHGRKPVTDNFDMGRKERLLQYSHVSETGRLKHCQEIFLRANDEDSYLKSILLTGKAGIGKTLFSQKLIRDWADDKLFQVNTNSETPDFKFAFLLTFRQLDLLGDDPVTLREILNRSSVLDDQSIIDESLFEYIAKHPEEVLIVIDEYDGYSQQDYIASHLDEKYPNSAQEKMPVAALFAKLIKGKILTGCVVITTSRPDESDEIKAQVRFDRYVEITGFSEEQVKEYIEKYFKDDEKIKNTVLDHIARNEELVSFAHIPVRCFLMCSYMEYLLKESKSTDTLPVKTSDLYFEIVNRFIVDHNKKEVPSEDTLYKLSELAAQLLLENRFLFVEEDMRKFSSNEVESLRASGLLHCGPPFRKSFSKVTKHFCFTHLTLQEYLAARWFVRRREIPSTRPVSSMVMQFMAGILSKKKDKEFMEKIMHEHLLPSNEIGRDSLLFRVKCLAEYGEKDFAKHVIKKHHLRFRFRRFNNLTDVDCISVSFLLDVTSALNEEEAAGKHQTFAEQPFTVDALSVIDSSLTQSGVRRICKSLENDFCAVTKLDLNGCRLKDECVVCMRGLVSGKLTELSLMKNRITDVGVICLSQSLKSSSCKVTSLDLSDNQITGAGVCSLSQAIQSSPCTSLDLGYNQITDAGVVSLSQALQSSTCNVTSLDLDDNQITDAGVTSLSQALHSSACKVTTLDLSFNQITDAGVISLSQALQSSVCKVTTLDLGGNQITDAGEVCLRILEHQKPYLELQYY